MARKRLQQSTADYLAIAVSPVLIMLLVGSLVFFLQEISYDGQYQGRVRWMLGWFVFATVLISRIGIEFGKAHASMYAGALALACTAFAFRFLEEYLIGMIVLMGVVWWCVNKLTWDCTVIDDSVKVSSAGLLQQSGMDDSGSEEDEEDEPVETAKQRRRRLRREELGLIEASSKPDEPSESESKPPSEKQRAPGVWVVYFSLAALPLFGVGQAFLPAEDDSIREGFVFLWIYVASALGLFLTTSFLGLRRYLRQRRIKMPTSITAAWVSSGIVIMLMVLGICLLIPRPHAGTSVTALLDRFSEDQSASDYAMSSNDAGRGEGRRTGKVDENSEDPGDKMSEEGEPTDAEGDGKKSGQSDQKGKSKSGEQSDENDKQQGQTADKESEKDSDKQQAQNSERGADRRQANKNRDASDSDSETSSSQRSRWKMPQIGSTLKWIIYGLFGGFIVWAIWKNRADLAAGAREFWDSIVNFWANLFGGKPKKKKEKPEEELPQTTTGVPEKTFADYDNPFTTGLAQRLSPDALVLYSEEAFRAYAREQGIDAGEDITPQEIGQQVSARFPEMAEAVRFLTAAHSRILYSSRPPLSFDIAPLEPLWTGMSRRESQPVG
ncbi:MAG: DUF4129 domain-containing protein [Planctomycetaceae bacterium]|nr:DUF4129 domain-containing protein [Planctomycetaceae bacterium]